MKCTDAKENLDALLDRELERARVLELENHLESCRFCRTEFENLQNVGAILRRNARISAPVSLDEKVFAAFGDFQDEKRRAKTENAEIEKAKAKSVGWFGVPRFVFAAASFLLVLTALSAFQLGKLTAINSEISAIETPRNEAAKSAPAESEKSSPTVQTIEVPIVTEKIIEKEKIIEIPVVREKIITRIVYKNAKDEKKGNDQNVVPKTDAAEPFTVKSRLKENQYSTQINLEGFQVISELKPIIIKGESNEK